jgi:DNA-binding XRE family transcriptional regulator
MKQSDSPFATRLRLLIKTCRMTQEEVAEAISVKPSTVYRHAAGLTKPRMKQVRAYEQFFSKTLKILIRFD